MRPTNIRTGGSPVICARSPSAGSDPRGVPGSESADGFGEARSVGDATEERGSSSSGIPESVTSEWAGARRNAPALSTGTRRAVRAPVSTHGSVSGVLLVCERSGGGRAVFVAVGAGGAAAAAAAAAAADRARGGHVPEVVGAVLPASGQAGRAPLARGDLAGDPCEGGRRTGARSCSPARPASAPTRSPAGPGGDKGGRLPSCGGPATGCR